MSPLPYPAAVLLLASGSLLSGCFSAGVRAWGWGNQPSTRVKVAAATADLATAPVQIPAFALAALNHDPYDKQAALERSELNRKAQEERMRQAQLIFNDLKQNPALLTDDAFWDQQATSSNAALLALIWYLQLPEAAKSPEINTYLLRRFPEESGAIFANGRATQTELTGIAGARAQPYKIRMSALDALLRDRSFDFADPWRKLVLEEFGSLEDLMFATSRFTRAELQALAADPTTPAGTRDRAAQSLKLGNIKPDPTTPDASQVPAH